MLSSQAAVVLNLVGIFAFSLSGALLALRQGYDVVGMAVLATVTALGGGMLRDVLLGVRVAALDHPWWLLLPLGATLVAFFFHPAVTRLRRAVEVVDAVGLGLFCVTGTLKALQLGAGPVPAVLLGSITGVAGGLVRDVLARETPTLFRPDSRLYAVPAVVGCALLVLLAQAGVTSDVVGVGAAALICGVRLLALWRGWTAPVPRESRLR
ncbi:trimeric intracellular cation channel family protein [Lapillicoccus jejuensis]|uniref:Putative membrane protein YeiH n=1 Tax=Lapillicoccus jejuensis TaxID=402171 RepID=A0A542DX49_9MICO|nr:trimeric intracellular cation channel family protein [Lapillicoccus jejuensis]TQJ07656.1 putative membrane protein YeiH [Lapillicoccus jejuensis]